MPNDFQNSAYSLTSVDVKPSGALDVPKYADITISAAKDIFFKLRNNHLRRIALYAEINGLIAGNPPYDVGELHAANLDSISNFNTIEPASTFERGCLAYWNLLFTSEYVINFIIRVEDPEAQRHADIMSKNWDKVVRTKWRSFDINVGNLCAQIVKFGVSPIVWSDERDPRWRVVELSKFFVPDQSQADLDMLSVICVETETPLSFLVNAYKQYKDRRNEKDCPWQIDQLEAFIAWVANAPVKEQISPEDLLELQQKTAGLDISYDRQYNDTVKIVSFFHKEYDGSISHYMFHRHWDAGGYLFAVPSQYKSLEEAFLIFTQSPGEFYIHNSRGLGHKMFSPMQAKMMADNSLVDLARWSSTPIIKSSALNTKDVDGIRFIAGVPTNIGGAEFIQNSLGANIQGIIASSQYIGQLIQKNAAFAGDDPALPDSSYGSISPTQVRLQAFREYGVLKNQVNHFYKTFDILLEQMVVKMLHSNASCPGYELMKEWKKRCLAEGVPEFLFKTKGEEKLPEFMEVRATRTAGAGSQVAHLIGLQEIGAMLGGSLGAKEQVVFKKEVIKAALGPEYVASLAQDTGEADEQAGGASLAGMENVAMKQGESPIFSLDNEQRSHFVTHMALASYVIQAIQQQQMSVIEAEKVFNVLVPHLQDHFRALQASPFNEGFVKQLEKGFNDVVRYATFNKKNAAEAAQAEIKRQEEAEQNQERVMTEEELKNFQVQNEERRKDMKVEGQAQRANDAAQVRAEAVRKKTDADIDTKYRLVDAEVATKQRKTESDVSSTQRKTEAQISAKRSGTDEEVLSNPREYLRRLNGETPSPFDIE